MHIIKFTKCGEQELKRLSPDLQKRIVNKLAFYASPESVYIKKVSPPSLSSLGPKLRKLGKLITKKDIEEAIAWARKKI